MRLSAMNMLAIREHSWLELKHKLNKKFPDSSQQVEQLLIQLVTDNLLSDERFTEVFIRSRMNKGYGPVKIRYELIQKGISSDIIEYNMQQNEQYWIEVIQKAWNKKFLNHKIHSVQDKLKQSRYLYQRGFSSDQINAFLKD